jgi:hypothetical protein
VPHRRLRCRLVQLRRRRDHRLQLHTHQRRRIDNDCVDGIDDGLVAPGWVCNANCLGVETAVCTGASGWDCDYDCIIDGGDVECDGLGDPVADESLCDGLDNDCDGLVDEEPGITNGSLLGTPCDNGGTTGVCLVEGTWACDPVPSADPVCCEIIVAGTCVSEVPDPFTLSGPETCNGLDDDCDGISDEGVGDGDPNMDIITISGSGWSFDIFAYESSRPDAEVDDQGTSTTAACSFDAKLPWTMVDHDAADAACWAINASGGYEVGGWEVCTADQWEYACAEGGASTTTYPYGDTYQPATCNGHDYPLVDPDQVTATGAATNCFSEWGTPDAFDMSGNVEEWTNSDRVVGSDTLYEIRGGSYNDLAGGMTCDFDFWAAEATFAMPNLGFRCCRGDYLTPCPVLCIDAANCAIMSGTELPGYECPVGDICCDACGDTICSASEDA